MCEKFSGNYHVIFRQIIWFEAFFFEKSILTLKFKHRDLINEIEISLWKISINWPFKYILSIFFSSQFHTNSPGDKFLCLTITPRPHTILSSFPPLDPLLIQQTSWTGQYECSLIFAVHKKGRVSDHSSFGTAATYLLAAHRIVRRLSTTDRDIRKQVFRVLILSTCSLPRVRFFLKTSFPELDLHYSQFFRTGLSDYSRLQFYINLPAGTCSRDVPVKIPFPGTVLNEQQPSRRKFLTLLSLRYSATLDIS